jgi:NADH-quinone oxidoreductase subunit G
MPTLKIDGQDYSVPPGTLLIEACRAAGIDIPHYCYHPSLTPVATCRMCAVEVKGQPKLVTSCSTPCAEGMEVSTRTPSVLEARNGVMEFLLLNHPLDCPICDQAGECKLQDYSYKYGSGDSRMAEPKRRYRYEDLGAKIVIDKNRCIHCTRCVRFTQEISGTNELTVVNRGSHLEVTTYSGRTMDGNPLAGNVVDLCPVGALTSREFRFQKRVWYLKAVPTISRLSPTAAPIWADVDQNRVWRYRPRPLEGEPSTHFILDEERLDYRRYDLDPAARSLSGMDPEAIAQALRQGPVAVVGQGTFGCDTAQRLGDLASEPTLRFGSGERTVPIRFPQLQTSEDGLFNRRGFTERGFRFGALEELRAQVGQGTIRSVVLLHDEAFSTPAERALLLDIIQSAPFSLVLEPIPSGLTAAAKASLPTATYLEERDFVVTHGGQLRVYERALEPPPGVRPAAQWLQILQRTLTAVPV